jgi:elongation factor P
MASSGLPGSRVDYNREFLAAQRLHTMSSIQATRLRKGMLLSMDGGLYRILDLYHITPGNKRAHVQCKLRDIRSGRLVDHKFRSEDDVDRATLDEHEMQFLYRDGDQFHFMNTESYEQVHLTQEVLGDSAWYLLPEAVISIEFYETEPVGIHLPPTVDLKVTDTVPGIKGATAAAQVKPATLETGLVVNVPAFVNTGDRVRISTETGEYLSRV